MRLFINPKGFSDINCAVLYRFNKFVPLPEDTKNLPDPKRYLDYFTYDKLMFKGSRNILSINSFSEYDYKYTIEKKKFNDIITPNLYTGQLKDLLGLEGINTISDYLIPTTINSSDPSVEYFGSCIINERTAIIIDTPGMTRLLKGVWAIEFYESDDIESNNTTGVSNFILSDALLSFGFNCNIKEQPSITLYLGPDPEEKFNETSSYFPFDSRVYMENRKLTTGLRDFAGLMEEITCDKIVTLILSQDSSAQEVNISYKSWSSSSNSNRNLDKYVLRNDRYYSTRKSLRTFSPSESSKDLYLDNRSGLLLGNILRDENLTPILKQRKIKSSRQINHGTTPEFSPFRCYSLGEKVMYNSQEWESVKDNNLGDFPTIGTGWILSSLVESIFTDRVQVKVEEDKGGRLIPGNYVTINYPQEEKVFEVVEYLGFQLDSSRPAFFSPGQYVKKFNIKNELIDGKLVKKISISSWDEGIKSGSITFRFLETGSNVELYIKNQGEYNDIPYSLWDSVFKESLLTIGATGNIYLTYDKTERKNFTISGDNAVCQGTPTNKDIILHFPDLIKYQPTKLVMRNMLDEETIIVESEPEKVEDEYIFRLKSDFVSSIWTVEVIDRILNIIVLENSDFEFSTMRGITKYGSTSFNFEFYCLDETKTPEDWIVYINDNEILYDKDNKLGNLNITYTYNSYRDIYSIRWQGIIEDNYTVKLEMRE